MLVNKIERLPQMKLAANSNREFLSASTFYREERVRLSDLWEVMQGGKTLLVAGVWQPSLLVSPELWLLLCEDFKSDLRANLRATRPLIGDLIHLYPNIFIRLERDNSDSKRFAGLYGFSPKASFDEKYEVWGIA